MEKYRLIMTCSEKDNRECVIFCDEEDETPAVDYCKYDETVSFDGIIEAELPGSFPVNWVLERSRF